MISAAFLALIAAATPPEPSVQAGPGLARYFSGADYPFEALRNDEEGIVGFEFTVTPEGRASDCRVTASSGSRALDEATCAILIARARFAPALDAAGHPVADHFSNRISWMLPPGPNPVNHGGANLASYVSNDDYPREAIRAQEQGVVEFEIEVSPEGLPARCRIVVSSGSRALDARTCAIMSERPRFRPARDAEGHAVADLVSGRIRWVLPGR